MTYMMYSPDYTSPVTIVLGISIIQVIYIQPHSLDNLLLIYILFYLYITKYIYIYLLLSLVVVIVILLPY